MKFGDQNRGSILMRLTAVLLVNATLLFACRGLAQQPEPIVDPEEVRSVMNEPPADAPEPAESPSGIDLLALIFRGGVFMIPIAVMSVIVVALAVERTLSLRRKRIIPRQFESEIRELSQLSIRFEPPAAMMVCQRTRCVASRVIQAMLRRTGQPIGDIERSATETVQLEADRSATPIRWLNLAAAATPLMGLLGTVWGMIVAFHESTTLSAGRSRSEQLSEGIYTALVTTLAGLVVAIPAAILAQYLENRVTKLFGSVEQLALDLAPGLSRFVGQKRLGDQNKLEPFVGGSIAPAVDDKRRSKSGRGVAAG